MKAIKILLLLTIPLLSIAHSDNNIKTYTLQEAISQKIAEVLRIQNIGNSLIQIKIKNTHKKKDFNIHFETGLQLLAKDSSEQDLIILEERTLLVKAGAIISTNLITYCAQAKYKNPNQGSLFELKESADGKLLELVQFLAPIKDVAYIAQQAIWAVTDDHDLKGLFHEDLKTSLKIQQFVANLTGKEAPKYTVRYKDGREGEIAFNTEVILIVGQHEYNLAEDALVTCQIFNEAGEMVQEVFNAMEQKKGKVRFNFQFKALDLPKGKYVSKVIIKGEIVKEEWVEA